MRAVRNSDLGKPSPPSTPANPMPCSRPKPNTSAIRGKEAARDNLDREAAQAAIGLTYFAVRLRRKAMTSLRSPWAST